MVDSYDDDLNAERAKPEAMSVSDADDTESRLRFLRAGPAHVVWRRQRLR